MTVATNLFNFTQIRDLNNPNEFLVRSKHVSLAFGLHEQKPLESSRSTAGEINLEKVKDYQESRSFDERTRRLAEGYNLIAFGDTAIEKAEPDTLAIAVSILLRENGKSAEQKLTRLQAMWETANPLPAEAETVFNLDKMNDLASLFLRTASYIEYRRFLAALRRVSYVGAIIDHKDILAGLSNLIESPKKPNRVGDLLFKSKILIRTEDFVVAPAKRENVPPEHPSPPKGPVITDPIIIDPVITDPKKRPSRRKKPPAKK